MKKRMDLAWGGGKFDVLLDLRWGALMPYASEKSAAYVHERLGGQNYYRSRSGLSGAGWVPGHMALRKVATYRTDVAYPGDFIDVEYLRDETVPGLGTIIAPMDYSGRVVAGDWPIAVLRGYRKYEGEPPSYEQLYLLDPYGMYQLLRGEGEFHSREAVIQFIPSLWEEPAERSFKFFVLAGQNPLFYRKALVGLFGKELNFDREECQSRTNRFWSRLGLHVLGEGDRWAIFKIAQGVCYSRHTREELSSVEGLQAVAPANVLILAPNLYLQETEQGFEAVGLFEFDGHEVEFEERIEDPTEAVRAMAGNFAEILVRLEAAARAKWEAEREYARQEEERLAAEAERYQDIRARCEAHADAEVTFADALAAGNCEPGTRNFRDRFFPGRDMVKLGELARFAAYPGVRLVLQHKLAQLEAAQ